MSEYRKRLPVPVSVESLFAWHERPGAFLRLSPPWDRPVVRSHTGGIRDGARIELAVRVGPLSTTWRLEHRDYIVNEQFRDVLLEGPFAEWTHTHRFERAGPDASVLDDHIVYRLPLGPVGALGSDFAEATLERVFTYRHALLAADLAEHATYADRPRLRVAITGATGFIGTALAAFLSTGGHDVLRIGRGAVRPGSVDVSWNPERGELDPRALEGVDAVIHLAGASIAERWTTPHRRALETSRVESTSLLAHSLAQLTRPPRILLSGSAIGIYGSRGDESLDEASTLGTDFLADVGKRWEAATAPAERAGIRVVHLRTGIVQGAAGGALAKQAPLFAAWLGGTLGPGTQWISPIALDDHLYAMHFCLMHDALRGPVNLVAPEPVTNAIYTRVLGEVMGRPTLAAVPAFALRALLGAEMANSTVLASQRVLPTALERAGFRWRYPALRAMLAFTLGRP
jgi:uncharacterized protein